MKKENPAQTFKIIIKIKVRIIRITLKKKTQTIVKKVKNRFKKISQDPTENMM